MRFPVRAKSSLKHALNLFFALTFAAAAAGGQTLAHKNWAGSGLTVEPWWQSAVLYQIDPLSGSKDGDLRGILERMDYLQSLHIDAVIVSPLPLPANFGKTAGAPPFDPRYGSADDLDELVQAATQRKMRLFVDLPLSASRSPQDGVNLARFWLSRGIAGLRLTFDTADAGSAALTAAQIADRVMPLQQLCATFAGQRVLLSDVPGAISATAPSRRGSNGPGSASAIQAGPQMIVDDRLARMPHLDADDLRQAMQPLPVIAGVTFVPESDTPDRPRSFERLGDGVHDRAIAKVVATALLTSLGTPLLALGQEVGSPAETPALEEDDADSLLNWYRRLSELRHTNPALQGGSMDLIAPSNPDIVAWVRREPATLSTTVPVLVLCNLTGRPLLVALTADLQRAGLETGNGTLHTILYSATFEGTSAATPAAQGTEAKEAAPVSMNRIALPPYGIYLGELPHQPGLQSAPLRHADRGSSASR